MTESDLAKLLISNPDLGIAGATNVHVSDSVARVVQSQRLSERQMQEVIFEECQRRALTIPDYGLLVGVPNGQWRPGQRMEVGLRRGFPDFILPIARHSRIGLAIETKISPNKPDENQLWWHRQLRVADWVVEVIYDDPQKAIEIIHWYLES